FVPMATESRLAPVPGPVPHSYPVNMELQLPEAFISTATHFTPIILTNEGETEEQESQHLGTVTIGGLITGQMSNGGLFIDPVSGTVRSGTQDLFYLSGSSDSSLDHASHQAYCGQTDTKTQGEKETIFRDQPALQDVIDLLKGQFSTTGCLDNGCQDIVMGMYTWNVQHNPFI
ncbi:hypothetical protein XENOCAPTIV_013351, partial [Xenoophorus captivus]